MRPLTAALVFALAAPAFAGSWLSGPSAYEQAVTALAAGEWDRAETLIGAARPDEGRVEWVQRLLTERRQADAATGYTRFREAGDEAQLRPQKAVFHAYAYHNIYLFLRTTAQPEALVHDALDRAEAVYQTWVQRSPGRLDPSLRWAYAALLHEADRAQDADDFLRRTASGAQVQAGPAGPGVGDADRFTLGFQMLSAYFHAARGDAEAALAYLLAARRRDAAYVTDWVHRSDDFWSLRSHPEFLRQFPR